jgi:hypothetical protein
MSNRGRQNVASYLIHDLGQDWLAGASILRNYSSITTPAVITETGCIWRGWAMIPDPTVPSI